jgi:hypothetical protein
LNGRWSCRTQYWKGTILAKFALIWFSGFRGEDLNVIFYQNMSNLHNRYISAERKYMLNYSLPCSCNWNLSSFWLALKQQWTIKIASPLFSTFSLVAILVGSRDQRTQFWKRAIQRPFHQSLVAIGPVVSEEKIKMWNVDGRTKSDDNSSHGLNTRTGLHKPQLNLSLN